VRGRERAVSGFVARVFHVQPDEASAALAGAALFFVLFCGYFMLRPVRETMGVAGGVDNLQWLFTGTFLATLAAMPLFGWLASKVRRRRILAWTYAFFALDLVGFSIAFAMRPDHLLAARTFYIWLSVFNLIAISLAWSVLADVFTSAQARRLFALMAGGASLGGLLGPLLGTLLVGVIGHAGLTLFAASTLIAGIAIAAWLHRWRDRHPLSAGESLARARPLGGNPFAGAGAVFRSAYLAGIALFVVLLTSVSTFLYFEQARLVAETFADPVRRTQVFGLIDTVVQGLAILTQVFFTGRIAQRLGVGVLLVAVPLVVAAGFLWLAMAPVFAVFVVVMVVRRAGEYALVRPGREMLYTVVAPEHKYKAKNFNDTVVYRGGDAISAWVKRGLDLIGEHPSLAMFIGAGIAVVWAASGLLLGRWQRRRENLHEFAPAGPDGTVEWERRQP
jgi:AAA family ATP:ADP antiporter